MNMHRVRENTTPLLEFIPNTAKPIEKKFIVAALKLEVKDT